MSRWGISRKLLVSIVAMLLVLIALGFSGLRAVFVLRDKVSGLAERDAAVLVDAGDARFLAAQMRAEIRHVVVGVATGDAPLVRTKIQATGDRFDQLIASVARIENRTSRADIEQQCAAIRTAAGDYQTIRLRLNEHAMRQDLPGTAKALDDIQGAGGRIQQGAENIIVIGRASLETSKADAANGARSQVWLLAALALVAMGVATASVIIVRQIAATLQLTTTEMRKGADQVVSSANEVSHSAQSLSQGATEQAASLEETSASMEEMASMTRKNAGNAERASTLVIGVSRQMNESNTALAEMVASMDAIKESSRKVAKIIKTIDEIAFQTNILALNAAVEAARAGESGMGFAVVADEVRSLAQRSAQAARDTAAMIEDSIARSNEGAIKVGEVAAAIVAITASVTQLEGIVSEVREASQQQSQGIDDVSRAIAEMEKVTQTTAATAEESAAASEELNAQAETSKSVVRRLEDMVNGAQTSIEATPAATDAARARRFRAAA